MAAELPSGKDVVEDSGSVAGRRLERPGAPPGLGTGGNPGVRGAAARGRRLLAQGTRVYSSFNAHAGVHTRTHAHAHMHTRPTSNKQENLPQDVVSEDKGNVKCKSSVFLSKLSCLGPKQDAVGRWQQRQEVSYSLTC